MVGMEPAARMEDMDYLHHQLEEWKCWISGQERFARP